MANDAWQRIKTVLAEALDQPLDHRAAYLDRACAGDAVLRADVESLLAAHDAAGDGFIATPAFAPLPDEDRDPNLGAALGPYRIERLIGHGGMGAVYLARRIDREFERQVAVKMIRRGMDTDLLVRRFRHERQILASLDHPHIARLFDGGTTADGRPYFVMEYVEGLPLDRYADAQALTTPARIRLFLRVVEAVQHAHDHQIVHRDLKPGNVLVAADGQPKLLDFGIAKLLDAATDASATFTALARPMTPDYASPEQVRGAAITPATDVYALGVLLYELLTGQRPYRLATRTPDELARVVCEQDPERPSAVVTRPVTTVLPDGTSSMLTPDAVSRSRDGSPEALRRRLHGPLDDIVLKALRKDPAARYATAAALADDLRRYLDDAPVDASRGARRYRAARALTRHRRLATAAALVLVTVTATALASRWLTSRTVTPATTAGVAGAPGSAVAEPAGPRRRSVAVLRFRNLSGQASEAWLATALAEMLTTELSGGGQLRLVSADTVARAERDAAAGQPRAPQEGLAGVRRALGADYLVVGSFVVSGAASARALRLDVQVIPEAGEPLALAETGSQADLFALVASTGRALRHHVGVGEPTADAAKAIRAATPQTRAAARLYAEGLERLRALDAVTARDRLERAAAAEPGSAMILMNLAAAWTALGYDARAETAAQQAVDAAGALSREQRLLVEGQWHEARKDWPKALTVYRTLWDFFSDNLEYGVRLAAAQTGAGRAADALETVTGLRALGPPQNQDPRIDLAEGAAAGALGDFPRELAAAGQAVTGRAVSGRRCCWRGRLSPRGAATTTRGSLPRPNAASTKRAAPTPRPAIGPDSPAS